MKKMPQIFFSLFCMWFVITNIVIGQISKKKSIDEYRLVWERNIFDPLRREPHREVRNYRKEEITPSDQIRLLGVLINGKESIMFFEGSHSSYNGQWKQGDIIAGFRIKKAHTNGVVLENKDKKIDLPVGSVIKKTNEEEWQIVSSSEYSVKTPESEKPASTDSKDAGASDILKRLMERRKQETGQ